MATARLKPTGKSVRRPQPTCRVCGETIEPGQDRYEWSFRYGGTYTQHASHGRPRPSETTQGNVSQLYAAQESVEDALAADSADYDGWRSGVEQALSDAAETAREVGSEYEAAAEPFGGQGPNQERYEACEQWADELDDAASNVADQQPEDVDELERDPAPTDEEREAHEQAVEQAASDARDEVTGLAENAIGELQL